VVDGAPAVRKAPVLAKKSAPERPGYYTVKPGDTLNRIAQRLGVRADNLAAWNCLANKNDIKVGQELRIRAPSGVEGVQTAAVTSSVPAEVRPLSSDSGKMAESLPQTVAPPVDTAPKQEEGIAWIWPADGKVTATFQEGKSKGVDIAGHAGQKVVAAADGKVLFASAIRGYGNLVIIKHSENLVSAYAHNRAILVKEGATVTKGQQIAEMGKSDTDTVKLHLEIRRQGRPVDPLRYLPAR
jgi:lipoprotein NlpD